MLSDVYFEFLDCSSHQVLRSRGLYPTFCFERALKYGIQVWECRHPAVKTYISRTLTNAKRAFDAGLIESVSIRCLEGGRILDQLVINASLGSERSVLDPQAIVTLEEELRAVLLKLSFTQSSLPMLSEGNPVSITFNHFAGYKFMYN